jgi:hypothetical protein
MSISSSDRAAAETAEQQSAAESEAQIAIFQKHPDTFGPFRFCRG